MSRQETIEAIVTAERRKPLKVVRSFSGQGYALLSNEGTTVGTLCATEAECAQNQNDAIQRSSDAFRTQLDKMTDKELSDQAAYWLKTPTPETPNTMKTTIRMTKTKDCKGSVRFDAPKTEPGKAPNAIDNVYISRAVPGINEAQSVTVHIEIP